MSKEKGNELYQAPASVLSEGQECLNSLIDKYTGQDLTQDLLARMILEAYVRAKTQPSHASSHQLQAIH